MQQKNWMLTFLVPFLACICALLTSSSLADVPPLINFQGKLTNAAGVPVANGTYSIRFRIYSAETGGEGDSCSGFCVWEETQNVGTQQGIYSVLLGSVNPLSASVFSGPDRYIGVKVGTETEMTPRRRIGTVPYAHVASTTGTGAAFLGDGSDGSVVLPNSTSLTSDRFYVDLTIEPGVVLENANYRVFASGTVTINGILRVNGNAGSSGGNGGDGGIITSGAGGTGGSGGSPVAAGFYKASLGGQPGTAGGKGSTHVAPSESSAPGSPGTNEIAGVVTAGGASGARGGRGGDAAGIPSPVWLGAPGGERGAGGVTTLAMNRLRTYVDATSFASFSSGMLLQMGVIAGSGGSSGGGGGGGRNTTPAIGGGGGGGAGGAGSNGGVVFIAAKRIVIGSTGLIEARGGDGGNGGNGGSSLVEEGYWGGVGGGGAGGSGGGGGAVILVYETLENSGLIDVSGGQGGAGGSAGQTSPNIGGQDGEAGLAGPSGSVIRIALRP